MKSTDKDWPDIVPSFTWGEYLDEKCCSEEPFYSETCLGEHDNCGCAYCSNKPEDFSPLTKKIINREILKESKPCCQYICHGNCS